MGYASEAIQNLERDEHAVRDNCGCPRCDRLRAEQRGFNRAVREIAAMATSNPPYGSMTVYAEAIRHRYPEAFAEGDAK